MEMIVGGHCWGLLTRTVSHATQPQACLCEHQTRAYLWRDKKISLDQASRVPCQPNQSISDESDVQVKTRHHRCLSKTTMVGRWHSDVHPILYHTTHSVRAESGCFGSEQLGHRRVLGVVFPRIPCCRRPPRQQPSSVELHTHLRNFVLATNHTSKKEGGYPIVTCHCYLP